MTLARCLMISVFPVPEGPMSMLQWKDLSDCVRDSVVRSVSGVITRLGDGPRYS